MECLDCGADNDAPHGRTFLLDEVFENSVDVEAGVQKYVQLECADCGAVIGYLGTAAAVGSQDVRGFY